jgi:hypothetical protein
MSDPRALRPPRRSSLLVARAASGRKLFLGCGALLFLVAVAFFFWRRDHIGSSSDLERVCEEKTRAYLVAKGYSPTHWTPTLEEGFEIPHNLLANWRVGKKQVDVMCTGDAGESIDSVTFGVGDPE